MNSPTQTVVITGAGSGIGYATAAGFLDEGANVVLNGRSREKLRDAAMQLGHSERLETIAADMTQPKAAEAIVAAATERFGEGRRIGQQCRNL